MNALPTLPRADAGPLKGSVAPTLISVAVTPTGSSACASCANNAGENANISAAITNLLCNIVALSSNETLLASDGGSASFFGARILDGGAEHSLVSVSVRRDPLLSSPFVASISSPVHTREIAVERCPMESMLANAPIDSSEGTAVDHAQSL